MTPQEWWPIGLAFGAMVVAVVAVLLGLIVATTRRIDRNTETIWRVGKEIAGNTIALWSLSDVAGAAPGLRRAAERLEESTMALAERVVARGREGGAGA